MKSDKGIFSTLITTGSFDRVRRLGSIRSFRGRLFSGTVLSNAGGLGASRAGPLSLTTSAPTAWGFWTGLSKVIGLWDNSVVAQPEPRMSTDKNRYQGKRILIIFIVSIP